MAKVAAIEVGMMMMVTLDKCSGQKRGLAEYDESGHLLVIRSGGSGDQEALHVHREERERERLGLPNGNVSTCVSTHAVS